MKMIDDMERKLQQSGKMDQVRNIAQSSDAQRLGEKLDAQKIEQAVSSGDSNALRNVLLEVLGTGEGKRLAQQLGNIMEGK